MLRVAAGGVEGGGVALLAGVLEQVARQLALELVLVACEGDGERALSFVAAAVKFIERWNQLRPMR